MKLFEKLTKFYGKQMITITTFSLLAIIILSTIPIGFSAPTAEPFVIDDIDAVFVGNWGTSSYISGFYGDVYRYISRGSGSNTATWSFNIPYSGSWEVLAIWSDYKNRATDAPYTINHAEGSTTIRVNQETRGGEWVSLGTFNFDTGITNVILSDDANEYVIADAIQLVPINVITEPLPTAESFVVDNDDATFVGTWPTSTYIPGYYGDNYRYHFTGTGSNTAKWNFNIPQAGYWEAFVMYSSYPNRATNAPYTINHAYGQTTIRINQETQGNQWVSLGTYNFNAGPASIVLSDDGNQFVIADAIQLVPKENSPQPPATTYVQLSYTSSPISVNALIDNAAVRSGTSIQVVLGESVTLSALNVDNYAFSHWLINNNRINQNPITTNANSDLNAVAVYTYQQPPPTFDSDLIVGVNIWAGTSTSTLTNRDIPLLKDMGITHLRVGSGVRESFVDTCIANGIDVIGTFSPNEDYYQRVLRFKGKIKAWIVFNEANYVAYGGFTPYQYAQMLKEAYTEAKRADPTVRIITSNFESIGEGKRYLQAIYDYGAGNYFDVLGIDPYCYPEPPTYPNVNQFGHTFWEVPELYDIMVKNGDANKPIWIIEFGYRTPTSRWPLSHSTVVTEQQQAQYLVQALELASTWDFVERLYIYEWADSADINTGHWGLITDDYIRPYEVKPAYNAVKNFLTNQN